MEALDSPRPSATSAHLMTMNCSVAPAPQNNVVTARRNLPELVAPEQGQAVVEFVDQEERVLLELLVIDAGVRYVEVEYGRHDVEQDADDSQGHFADGVDAGVEQREVEGQQVLGDVGADQHAADERRRE